MNSSDTCYAILQHKIQGVDTPIDTVERHIEFIKNLDDSGQLVLAGPFTDFHGGMIIIHAESLEKATQIAQSDPFVTEGARTFEVRTWVMANQKNDYLRAKKS